MMSSCPIKTAPHHCGNYYHHHEKGMRICDWNSSSLLVPRTQVLGNHFMQDPFAEVYLLIKEPHVSTGGEPRDRVR